MAYAGALLKQIDAETQYKLLETTTVPLIDTRDESPLSFGEGKFLTGEGKLQYIIDHLPANAWRLMDD